jgi:hypothetical protein
MKVAVIGEGPRALETTLFFIAQDCSVSLFSEVNKVQQYFSRYFDKNETLETSEIGRKLTSMNSKKLSILNYQDQYFNPLWEKLSTEGALRNCCVNRVTKAHLSSYEIPRVRTRLADLFRVTFEMNTEKMVEEQRKQNEGAFSNMSPETMNSLKRSIEMAEDYDIVILANEVYSKNRPIGIGENFCLNESFFSREESFFTLGTRDLGESVSSVALFGDTNGLSFSLANISKWLKSGVGKKVYILNKDKEILRMLGQTNSEKVNKKVESILEELSDFHSFEKKRLEQELLKWNALEDYERVKYPRPQMKEPEINILPAMNVISIDQLDESKKFFLTLEPSKDLDQLEKFLGISTIGVDAIINSMPGEISPDLIRGLNIGDNEIRSKEIVISGEPGFFNISSEIQKYDMQNTNESIKIIFNEIKKYFSKQGE